MRGKSFTKKRKLVPDEKYDSLLIAEFINKVMLDGKKSTATRIVYKCLSEVETKTKKKALESFDIALKNGAPLLEVRSKRIGGATYQVPVEVSSNRKVDLVLRWLIESARSKQGQSMEKYLADEILAMYKGEGTVIKKRNDVHKMAEANKAFAHFARL